MCPIVFLGMMYLAAACNYQCQYCSSTSHRSYKVSSEDSPMSGVFGVLQWRVGCYCSKYDN